MGFLIVKQEYKKELVQGTMSLSLVIFYYRLYILKDVFTYMVLIDSVKEVWRDPFEYDSFCTVESANVS